MLPLLEEWLSAMQAPAMLVDLELPAERGWPGECRATASPVLPTPSGGVLKATRGRAPSETGQP
jgi:hypothetical protein